MESKRSKNQITIGTRLKKKMDVHNWVIALTRQFPHSLKNEIKFIKQLQKKKILLEDQILHSS